MLAVPGGTPVSRYWPLLSVCADREPTATVTPAMAAFACVLMVPLTVADSAADSFVSATVPMLLTPSPSTPEAVAPLYPLAAIVRENGPAEIAVKTKLPSAAVVALRAPKFTVAPTMGVAVPATRILPRNSVAGGAPL